ncbi:MAG: cold-shock protein [Planctomycetota bacterium]
MLTGSVARFDARRGYGFLVPDDGGEDVFVHQNNIVMDGFRFLNPGERVRFDVEEGARGRKAVSVELLEPRQEQDNRRNGTSNNRRTQDRERRPPRRERRDDADLGQLQEQLQRLRRKHERLISLLVEKEVLAPGEIDQLPGLEEITASAEGHYADEDEDQDQAEY